MLPKRVRERIERFDVALKHLMENSSPELGLKTVGGDKLMEYWLKILSDWKELSPGYWINPSSPRIEWASHKSNKGYFRWLTEPAFHQLPREKQELHVKPNNQLGARFDVQEAFGSYRHRRRADRHL